MRFTSVRQVIIINNKLILFLNFIAIFAAWSLLGFAEDRFVDNNKNASNLGNANDCRDPKTPCETIQRAIDAAKSGDTIKVFNSGGTAYKGPLTIEGKQLKLVAMNPNTTIEAGEGEAVIKITGPKAAGSLVQGFTIMVKGNPKNAPQFGIFVNDTSSVELRGNKVRLEIESASMQEEERIERAGILLRNSSSNTVMDNEIVGKKIEESDGIRLEAVDKSTLSGNKVSDSGRYGILVVGGVEVGKRFLISKENKLLGNTARDNGLSGIVVVAPSETELSDNVAIENEFWGIFILGRCEENGKLVCMNNKFVNNRSSGNRRRDGIILSGRFKNITVKGNTTGNNAGAGTVLKGIFTNTTFSNNIANDNCEFGIFVEFAESINNALSGNMANGNGSIDLGLDLVPFKEDEKHAENVEKNNGYNPGEFIYRMTAKVRPTPADKVTVGDTRLTDVVIGDVHYKAGSIVADGDKDIGFDLIAFKPEEKHAENKIINLLYDPEEFIYSDIHEPEKSKVSSRDIRLTSVGGCPAGTTVEVIGIGISFTGSNTIVSSNTANGNGKSGIEVSGSNNALSNNTANNNGEAGIALAQGSENTLLNNTALSNGIGISLNSSRSNKLLENTVKNNRCNGIELDGSNGNEIRNNSITLNAKEEDTKCADHHQLRGGIVLIGASLSNKISGNVIQENFNGISIRDSSQGNTFVCNSITRNEKNGIQLLNQAIENILQNNNIEGNQGSGVRNFMDQSVDVRYNWWSHPLGPNHSSNSAGQGDKILGPAIYTPWLEKPVDIQSCS